MSSIRRREAKKWNVCLIYGCSRTAFPRSNFILQKRPLRTKLTISLSLGIIQFFILDSTDINQLQSRTRHFVLEGTAVIWLHRFAIVRNRTKAGIFLSFILFLTKRIVNSFHFPLRIQIAEKIIFNLKFSIFNESILKLKHFVTRPNVLFGTGRLFRNYKLEIRNWPSLRSDITSTITSGTDYTFSKFSTFGTDVLASLVARSAEFVDKSIRGLAIL